MKATCSFKGHDLLPGTVVTVKKIKSNVIFFGVYSSDNLPIPVTLQPCGTKKTLPPLGQMRGEGGGWNGRVEGEVLEKIPVCV